MDKQQTPVDEEVLKSLKDNVNKEESKPAKTSLEERKYAEEDRENAFDDYYEYKKAVRNSIKEQIKFKDKWRKITLVSLIVLTGILFLNLFILLYLPDVTLGKYTFPTMDNSIIVILVSATFLNTFALLTLIFKYIFSPTDSLMQHNKDME